MPNGLVTQVFPGAPGGSNVAIPASELDDTEARIIQDGLVDYPGLTRRRGPVRGTTGVAALSRKGTGIVMTLDPTGSDRYAVLTGDGSNGYFTVYAADLQSNLDLAWPHPLPTNPSGGAATAFRIYDAKAALNGGAMVGVSSAYDANNPNQALAYWRGGTKANYTAGTLTATRGSASVTGSGTAWLANATPGMWLFANTDTEYLSAPSGLVATGSTTGGTLAAATYYYKVTALNGSGETTGSTEVSVTTTGTTSSVALTWTAVPGATSYRIYRGTAAASENVYYTSTSNSFTDTGAANTGGTVPVSNTASLTGNSMALIGAVRAVNSDTSITLDKVSPYTATAKAYTLQSIRGVYPKVTVGRITADVNANVVNGGNTKFRSQGLGSGVWNLYRADDLAWIGRVGTVASETSLALVGNAAVAVSDEAYVALRADADFNLVTTGNVNKPGFLTATYAERQWFANNGAQFEKNYRVWFTDTSDPEALDMSDDGNWIPISSTGAVQEAIRAIAPAYNALVVMKENETFAIYGTSPASFSVKKLEDDGALSGMSVQQFGGGVIWAGRQGIHFYDGITVRNLTADPQRPKLGDVWKNSVKSFDPSKYRMYAFMDRNHYVLHIEKLDPTIAIIKGNVSTTPTSWIMAVNMETEAITWFTNVKHRGAVVLPASTGRNVWYLVNDNTKGYIADASDLFDVEGVDAFGADGGAAGPDFFFESKKFDGGDGMRLKRFKLFSMNYLVQGGDIKVDVVLGLNEVGKTLSSVFPASVYTWNQLRTTFASWNALKSTYATWSQVIQGVFKPRRVQFTKQSEYMAFRLYQSSPSIARLRIGPYKIGYKVMRDGRV